MTHRMHHGLWLSLYVPLLLSACGRDEEPEQLVRPVRYVQVFTSGGARVRTFSGVAQAAIESPLSFRVAGSVLRLPVEVGDQVRAGQLIAHPILWSILGQPKSTLDLRSVMDDGRILICNLSKGRIGEDGSAMLGSLLVTSLQLAAMSRNEGEHILGQVAMGRAIVKCCVVRISRRRPATLRPRIVFLGAGG